MNPNPCRIISPGRLGTISMKSSTSVQRLSFQNARGCCRRLNVGRFIRLFSDLKGISEIVDYLQKLHPNSRFLKPLKNTRYLRYTFFWRFKNRRGCRRWEGR